MNTQETETKLIADLKAKYGTVYSLTVPVNDEETEHATIHLRKMDRLCYQSVSKLIQKDELTGVESFLKTLRVGGCEVSVITGNFDALRSAAKAILPMLTAKDADLKKN